jgi:secondary thiamine-phosphate synthase enzyme
MRVQMMPAHIKASLLGNNLTIPIIDGALGLGMWQGIVLGEHRVRAGSHHLIATICGKLAYEYHKIVALMMSTYMIYLDQL